jgi:hypothetical protein
MQQQDSGAGQSARMEDNHVLHTLQPHMPPVAATAAMNGAAAVSLCASLVCLAGLDMMVRKSTLIATGW